MADSDLQAVAQSISNSVSASIEAIARGSGVVEKLTAIDDRLGALINEQRSTLLEIRNLSSISQNQSEDNRQNTTLLEIKNELKNLSSITQNQSSADEPSLRDRATAFMDSGPARPAPAAAAPAAAPAAGGGGDKKGGKISPLAMMAVAGAGAALAALAGILAVDADAIKDKVETLLSIVELPNMTPEAVAGVSATLGALGAGLAVFGVGSAVAGVGEAVANFMGSGEGGGDWADTIYDNVETLLSIADMEGMTPEAVAGVSLTLGALGAGLAAFALGKTAAGVAEGASSAIKSFGGGGFNAQGIVDEVNILVGMAEDWDWATVASAVIKFPTVMGALGLGLAFFGAGKAVEGVSEGVQGAAEHIQKFSAGGGFGERVKSEVTSLLSILNDPNATFTGGLGFIGVMGSIGAGLVAYSIGKGAEGAAEGAQIAGDYISKFGEEPFAERVKTEVTTLLTIPTLPGNDLKAAGNFALVMGTIGAGLVAFALGKGAEGVAEGGQAALKSFTEGEGFADRIKTQVSTLLGMLNDENINVAKAEEFSSVMGSIAAGLTKFAASKFISAFADIGSAITGFFSGKDSSISQVLKLAGKVDELKEVGSALDSITGALRSFGNIKIDTDDLAIDKLVHQLAKALPWIDALAHGGELDGSGTFSDTTIKKGLLDPSLQLDEMVDAINKVNQVLGIGGAVGQTPSVAPGAGAAGGATKAEMVQSVAMQAGTVSLQAPNVTVNMPEQEGGGQEPAGRDTTIISGPPGQTPPNAGRKMVYG